MLLVCSCMLCMFLWIICLLWLIVSRLMLCFLCRCRLVVFLLIMFEVGGIIVLEMLVWLGLNRLFRCFRCEDMCRNWFCVKLLICWCGFIVLSMLLIQMCIFVGGVRWVLLLVFSVSSSGVLCRVLVLFRVMFISGFLVVIISLNILFLMLQVLVKQFLVCVGVILLLIRFFFLISLWLLQQWKYSNEVISNVMLIGSGVNMCSGLMVVRLEGRLLLVEVSRLFSRISGELLIMVSVLFIMIVVEIGSSRCCIVRFVCVVSCEVIGRYSVIIDGFCMKDEFRLVMVVVIISSCCLMLWLCCSSQVVNWFSVLVWFRFVLRMVVVMMFIIVLLEKLLKIFFGVIRLVILSIISIISVIMLVWMCLNRNIVIVKLISLSMSFMLLVSVSVVFMWGVVFLGDCQVWLYSRFQMLWLSFWSWVLKWVCGCQFGCGMLFRGLVWLIRLVVVLSMFYICLVQFFQLVVQCRWFFGCSLCISSLVNVGCSRWCLLWCFLCYGFGKQMCILLSVLLVILFCSIFIVLWWYRCMWLVLLLVSVFNSWFMFGVCILMLMQLCDGLCWVVKCSVVLLLKLIFNILCVGWLKVVFRLCGWLVQLRLKCGQCLLNVCCWVGVKWFWCNMKLCILW